MLGPPEGERRGGAGKEKPGEEEERETGVGETGKGGERKGNREGGQEGMGVLALLPCRHAFVLSANPESPLYSGGKSYRERGPVPDAPPLQGVQVPSESSVKSQDST